MRPEIREAKVERMFLRGEKYRTDARSTWISQFTAHQRDESAYMTGNNLYSSYCRGKGAVQALNRLNSAVFFERQPSHSNTTATNLALPQKNQAE